MATTTRTTKAASGTKKTTTATASKSAAKPAEKVPAKSTGAKKTSAHVDEAPVAEAVSQPARATAKAKSGAQPQAESHGKQPATQHEIALRAYFIWQQRGGEHGSHEQDWLEAERQLLAR